MKESPYPFVFPSLVVIAGLARKIDMTPAGSAKRLRRARGLSRIDLVRGAETDERRARSCELFHQSVATSFHGFDAA